MELPSSDKFYSMSVESMDTSKLLKNAARQRDARKFNTFPIIDCDSHFVITANEGLRGGRIVPLKNNVDKDLERCPNVKNVLVVSRTSNDVL